MKSLVLKALLLGSLQFNFCAFAQTSVPKDVVAIVNGKEIPVTYFDLALKSALIQGQQDSAQLQDNIRRKLITTAVLSQKSLSDGLDKNPTVQAAIAQAKDNLLAEALISNFVSKNPINDEDVRGEYQKQISLLGPAGMIEQYQISDIVLSSEADLNKALERIKKGESFASVAKGMSIAPSRINGGSLGWVYTSQLSSQVAQAISTMKKGSVSSLPISNANSSGWYIVKLDDKRLVKAPSFDEAKNTIRNNLMQKKSNEYISKLMNEAKIIQ